MSLNCAFVTFSLKMTSRSLFSDFLIICLLQLKGLHSHFCSGSIDIGYLLDSSGSLRNHYQNEKEILKTLATVSGISEYGPHIGVVLFSSRAFLSIALNEHLNLPSFKKAVDELPLIGTLTSIDRALEVAKNQLLDPRYGRRIDVPSVVILITDGSQSYLPKSKDPVEVARRLRDEGTTIFAVGVGDEIDMRELMLITGSERLTFKMDSFREAMSSELLRRIKTITCPQAPEPLIEPVHCKLDIGIVMDSSGSIKKMYMQEKAFVKYLASAFNIRKNGARIGVVSFSSTAVLSYKLNDIDSFEAVVNEIPLMGEHTRIDKGLRLVQSHLFLPRNGGRPGVRKLVILLTEGPVTELPDTENLAHIGYELRRSGITVMAVGVGPNIDLMQLKDIAGRIDNTFVAPTFDDMQDQEFIDVVWKKSCGKSPPRHREPTTTTTTMTSTKQRPTSTKQMTSTKQRPTAKITYPVCWTRATPITTQSTSTTTRKTTTAPTTTPTTTTTTTKKTTPRTTTTSSPTPTTTTTISTTKTTTAPTTTITPATTTSTTKRRPRRPIFVRCVNHSYRKVCKRGKRKTTAKPIGMLRIATTIQLPKRTAPSLKTKQKGPCQSCCGGDVYINVFQPGSGGKYVVQGLDVVELDIDGRAITDLNIETENDNSLEGATQHKREEVIAKRANDVRMYDKKSMTVLKRVKLKLNKTNGGVVKGILIKLIKRVLPNKQNLADKIVNLLQQNTGGKDGHNTHRKRRSSTFNLSEVEHNFIKIQRLAKSSSCSFFLKILKRMNLVSYITTVITKTNRNVTIFCPTDSNFKGWFRKYSTKVDVLNVLRQHIGFDADMHGRKFNTLRPNHPVHINPLIDKTRQITWQANGREILFSFTDGKRSEIVLIKDVL